MASEKFCDTIQRVMVGEMFDLKSGRVAEDIAAYLTPGPSP
jgi:hypothetical protein